MLTAAIAQIVRSVGYAAVAAKCRCRASPHIDVLCTQKMRTWRIYGRAAPAVGIQCWQRQCNATANRRALYAKNACTAHLRQSAAPSSAHNACGGGTTLQQINVPCTQKMCARRICGKSAARRRHTMLTAATAHTTVKKRGAGSRGQRVLLPRAAFGEIGVLSHGCSAGSRSSGFLPRATSRKVECAVSPFLFAVAALRRSLHGSRRL